jgi:hypothetical protein
MRSLGRIALLLNGLQAHILTDLLQALFHFLETLEFAQLFVAPRRDAAACRTCRITARDRAMDTRSGMVVAQFNQRGKRAFGAWTGQKAYPTNCHRLVGDDCEGFRGLLEDFMRGDWLGGSKCEDQSSLHESEIS